MQIGNAIIQRELAGCFEDALRQKHGPVAGALYGEILRYQAGGPIDFEKLRDHLDNGAVPMLSAIVSGNVTNSTLHAVRSLMIGSALLGDTPAVTRWATAGLTLSQKCAGDWPGSEPQWQWVLRSPEQFMLYARQIKHFLNQI